MDSDRKAEDFLRLNALVDGELGPTERAELAARLVVERDLARTYSTLARLKATIGESIEEMPEILLPSPRRAGRRFIAAAACIAVIAIGLAAATLFRSDPDAAAPGEEPTAITLASLPAGTTIPRLDTAGLKLVSLAIDPGHVPIFTASYRGPHGCRLDLRAWPAQAAAPPAIAGSSRHGWTVGNVTYELVAHGMPAWRFDMIADASELQTRLDGDHNRINRRLRQAAVGAPPCTG
jgi:anti-sigma factor RsiW